MSGGNGQRVTWLHPDLAKDYIRWVKAKKDRRLEGVLYAVTSPYYSAVKLGRWSGSIDGLRMRYKTVFPTDMQLIWVETTDTVAAEKRMLCEFKEQNIGGEVHLKAHIRDYIAWLKTLGPMNHMDVALLVLDLEKARTKQLESETQKFQLETQLLKLRVELAKSRRAQLP